MAEERPPLEGCQKNCLRRHWLEMWMVSIADVQRKRGSSRLHFLRNMYADMGLSLLHGRPHSTRLPSVSVERRRF